MDSWIRGVVIPVVVAIALGYFRKHFPVTKIDDSPVTDAQPVSVWWTACAISLWVVASIAIVVLLASVWRSVNALWSGAHGLSAVSLYPTGAWWYLYSGFAALSFSWYSVRPALNWLMAPRQFAMWERRQFKQCGFDSDRALKWLGLIIMVPYTVFFLPSLGCHTRFTESGVAIQGYADLSEHFYPYGEVSKAAVVRGYRDRSGDFHYEAHVAIRFVDHKLWTSRNGFRDPEPIRQDLLSLLRARLGRSILEVETDAEM